MRGSDFDITLKLTDAVPRRVYSIHVRSTETPWLVRSVAKFHVGTRLTSPWRSLREYLDGYGPWHGARV